MQKQMALFSPGSWPETVQILCALAPIWLFGALIGLLVSVCVCTCERIAGMKASEWCIVKYFQTLRC